jgi:CRP-like cAMP-binding protein
MRTNAQLAANRENAQLSTGPKTDAGKAVSSQNHFQHGLSGTFRLLPDESSGEYIRLLAQFMDEHKPSTPTETVLVEKLVQHLWLSRRAINLQPDCSDEKQLALYLRYQTTNDRAFHKCLAELAKLRAEKRKSELGFESQKRQEAEEARRQAAEQRKAEIHPASAAAVEASEVVFLSRDDIRAACLERPEVSLKILKVFGGRLRRLVGIIEELSFTSLLYRLISWLLKKAKEGVTQPDGAVTFQTGASHQEIAAHIGTVRELVSRNLARLQAQGLIQTNGQEITIPPIGLPSKRNSIQKSSTSSSQTTPFRHGSENRVRFR